MFQKKSSHIICFLFIFLIAGSLAVSDTVYLHDGTQIDGVVLSLQKNMLSVKRLDGQIEEIGKDQIERIEFRTVEAELPARKLDVAVKNIETDDYIDIYVNSQKVVERARKGGEWKNVTSLLKKGANEVKVYVHNDTYFWSYKWAIRVNGRVFIQQCGEPGRPMGMCTRFGMSGKEIGLIESIPPVWLYVDFQKGTCEIVD